MPWWGKEAWCVLGRDEGGRPASTETGPQRNEASAETAALAERIVQTSISSRRSSASVILPPPWNFSLMGRTILRVKVRAQAAGRHHDGSKDHALSVDQHDG